MLYSHSGTCLPPREPDVAETVWAGRQHKGQSTERPWLARRQGGHFLCKESDNLAATRTARHARPLTPALRKPVASPAVPPERIDFVRAGGVV